MIPPSDHPARPVAAITGGASGIGLAFARRWIQEGGRVVLLDFSPSTLADAVAKLGPDNARGLAVDVTQNDTVLAAYASIDATEGRLDTVLNAAGIARPAPSADVSDEDFTLMLDIHVTGTMRSCRAAYPLLKRTGGTIVNVASVAALTGMPGRASYTTAKAGIAGLTRTLAVEWGREGVRVNAVGPGYVRTALIDTLIAEGKLRDTLIRERTALGRFAEAAEIAEAVHFLASPASSYVNGHLLMADGGLTVDGNWY
ncbi:SDR family NAD(P)-dependent oxidoreductase [Leucobacter sp. M11]|uniref:SDR family NAD(P)-dependent oxidoreductase n=1 Tax=Leucobacter sp. M11 TaxID=2993565 RepID=UPI002D7EC095|nr:SDR family oxidoreductase [Leucobacter sp. M11]MEB4613904.1 SDR family NAD(P)-dependent oxidoreductase [Leucobacter sp. M11]